MMGSRAMSERLGQAIHSPTMRPPAVACLQSQSIIYAASVYAPGSTCRDLAYAVRPCGYLDSCMRPLLGQSYQPLP